MELLCGNRWKTEAFYFERASENAMFDLTHEDAAEKLSIRIRVCLQPYRKSLKNASGFSRWVHVPRVNSVSRSA
jgi:uncharacterized membrane protein